MMLQGNKQRHFAFILPGYPPETHSWGIGVYGKLIAEALAAKDIKITIFSRTLESTRSVETNGNITVIRLPSPPLEKNGLDLIGFAKTLFDEWHSINIDYPIDYTECADWGGEGYFFVKNQIPKSFAVRIHSPGFLVEDFNSLNPSYLSMKTKKIEKETIQGAKYIIANSTSALRAIGPHLAPEVSTFISPYICAPHSLKSLPTSNDGYKQLVCVGRLEQRKGPDLLIDALKGLGRDTLLKPR